ncbi:MAG TPA: hypothetical protein ENO03_06010 [Candidatus Aminicenantes bacterium]|nr:hypothetical protein [Candidatus Aminicenantes bacterium]
MRQDEDFVKDEIEKWLKGNALGRENAKPRRLLKNHLVYALFLEISDRTLRRYYRTMNNIGYSCRRPRGIFWIEDLRDLQAFKAEQEAKAISIFTRTKKTQIAVEGRRQLELPR